MTKKRRMPNKVSNAITLLWITTAIIILSGVIVFSSQLDTTIYSNPGFIILATIISFVFMVFFIEKIKEGKDWARITYLVLLIAYFPFYVIGIISLLLISPIISFLEISQLILQIIAMIFLFQKESSNWFNSMRN